MLNIVTQKNKPSDTALNIHIAREREIKRETVYTPTYIYWVCITFVVV